MQPPASEFSHTSADLTARSPHPSRVIAQVLVPDVTRARSRHSSKSHIPTHSPQTLCTSLGGRRPEQAKRHVVRHEPPTQTTAEPRQQRISASHRRVDKSSLCSGGRKGTRCASEYRRARNNVEVGGCMRRDGGPDPMAPRCRRGEHGYSTCERSFGLALGPSCGAPAPRVGRGKGAPSGYTLQRMRPATATGERLPRCTRRLRPEPRTPGAGALNPTARPRRAERVESPPSAASAKPNGEKTEGSIRFPARSGGQGSDDGSAALEGPAYQTHMRHDGGVYFHAGGGDSDRTESAGRGHRSPVGMYSPARAAWHWEVGTWAVALRSQEFEQARAQASAGSTPHLTPSGRPQVLMLAPTHDRSDMDLVWVSFATDDGPPARTTDEEPLDFSSLCTLEVRLRELSVWLTLRGLMLRHLALSLARDIARSRYRSQEAAAATVTVKNTARPTAWHRPRAVRPRQDLGWHRLDPHPARILRLNGEVVVTFRVPAVHAGLHAAAFTRHLPEVMCMSAGFSCDPTHHAFPVDYAIALMNARAFVVLFSDVVQPALRVSVACKNATSLIPRKDYTYGRDHVPFSRVLSRTEPLLESRPVLITEPAEPKDGVLSIDAEVGFRIGMRMCVSPLTPLRVWIRA
ncbi:hypothetical protein BKA93DRAFT_750831 [Sparassis latifolia]